MHGVSEVVDEPGTDRRSDAHRDDDIEYLPYSLALSVHVRGHVVLEHDHQRLIDAHVSRAEQEYSEAGDRCAPDPDDAESRDGERDGSVHDVVELAVVQVFAAQEGEGQRRDQRQSEHQSGIAGGIVLRVYEEVGQMREVHLESDEVYREDHADQLHHAVLFENVEVECRENLMPESLGILVLSQVRSVLDHEDHAHAHEDQEHAEDQEEIEVVHLLDDLAEEQSAHDGPRDGKHRHDGAHLSAVALFRDIGGPGNESRVVRHGSDEAHEAVTEHDSHGKHEHLAVIEILGQSEQHHRDAPQSVSDEHLRPSPGKPVSHRSPYEASECAGHR